VAWNSTFLGSGVRDVQVGRQNTPVVRTATQNLPSASGSLAAINRYISVASRIACAFTPGETFRGMAV
jgi:hypothetical protein